MSRSIIFKALTVGDGAVGKTTLLNRYISGEFRASLKMTLGFDILNKLIKIENYDVMLQLWDFGGQEQFRYMQNNYTFGASGAIIMFDLTRASTLKSIEEWVKICRTHDENIPLILVGGKLDLIQTPFIDYDYILQVKKSFDFIDYIETSSKTGENVHKVFDIFTKNMLEYQGFPLKE